jgi:PAS domain S-box-containing protein
LGKIVGYIVLAADISDRLQAEAETGDARANLEKAQRMAQIGSWERNLKDQSVYWSPEMFRIFDYDPDRVMPAQERLWDRIHPDDKERVVQTQRSAIEGRAERYASEFRILRGDGSVRHIVGGGEIGYDGDGAAQWIAGTSQDITAARRAQDALEAAKREAENANRAKSEFLASMSHKLRTPMNAILGYAQLLLQNKKEPVSETQKRQVGQILKSGQHLLFLINDILDLSKIETGRVAFELRTMEAASAVGECIGLIAALAEKNRLTVINGLKDEPPPPILADGIRLKQALLNLLSNAIKFNRPGGRVEVSARPLSPDFIRISIADTGIGIPEEKAAELFEPFGRLDAEQRGIEGTGIGLTITRQLVERMNGSVGYASTPGQGSTFWIDIPAAVPGHVRQDAATKGAGALDLEPGQDGASDIVILYIEDDLSNRQLLKEVVGHLPGKKLVSAHSAEDGIEIARQTRPGVIVMDINLPGMSGLEAVNTLHEDPKTSSIPVIALSAAAMSGDIERGERAEFFAI